MKPILMGLLAASVALGSLGSPTITAAADSPTTTGDKAVKAIDDFIASQKIDKTKANWKSNLPKPPVAAFDAKHKYVATVVTNKGTIKIQLKPDVAPMHVSSFIYLTRLGFYDGISFHRVIPGFMAQGGCPLGTGTGGPGYQYDGEINPNVNKHDKGGMLSMANAGPGTDGSQFFLTFVPTPWLDKAHTIYGEVIEGKDVLSTLEKFGSAPAGKTTEPLRMETVTVEAL